jgi:alkanesulfonate monooxygenase SsuD/methylene tetrahydromethanopterin reductase-like flavin-dependent oxidoreductase (luciferase family)
MPLYHPIRLAEDLAVLDLLGQGRIDLVFIEGYRHEEFEMMEVDITQRGQRMTEFIEVLKNAWTGEPFEWHGHRAWVTPKPFQQPRPRIGMGGSAPASARRAAQIADSYHPTVPEMVEVYRAEMVRLGKEPGPALAPPKPGVKRKELLVAVSNDPESTWKQVGPICVEYMNSFAEWIRDGAGAVASRYSEVPSVEALRRTGVLLVLSPDECVRWIRDRDGKFMIQPLLAGIPPSIGWESLRIIEQAVLPAL